MGVSWADLGGMVEDLKEILEGSWGNLKGVLGGILGGYVGGIFLKGILEGS